MEKKCTVTAFSKALASLCEGWIGFERTECVDMLQEVILGEIHLCDTVLVGFLIGRIVPGAEKPVPDGEFCGVVGAAVRNVG